jgi:desulfoferrodoxin (superoxide reductase-like protein)
VRPQRILLFSAVSLAVLIFGVASPGWAGRSSVTIEAPVAASKGAEITVKINVAHNGNSRFHHTEWVSVKVNGEEIRRWEYSGSSTPESEQFTKDFKLVVNEPVEIVAEASCNLHGSAGPDKANVAIQ